MQIRNAPVPDAPNGALHPALRRRLEEVRRARNFDPELYLRAKAALLNDYMARAGLSACVVAVSGGIDSAVVLGILRAASRRPGSPIRRILGVPLPVFRTPGATGQDTALARGLEVCAAFDVAPTVIDLSEPHAGLRARVDAAAESSGGPWAVGQLVSYLRTPALYYLTSLLSQDGTPGILCGTTNRDEGGYLGYFGKASDGMVDVQLISDLHKSEVRRLAQTLGVPRSVIEVAPTGDMFDGTTDEDVFGAPYDFVELYLDHLGRPEEERAAWLARLPAEARRQFDGFAANLEAMHRYNHHKYLGRSPAVHLDVLEAAVPGGWDNRPAARPVKSAPSRIVGRFELDPSPVTGGDARRPAARARNLDLESGLALEVADLLSAEDCRLIRDALAWTHQWVAAGRDGYAIGAEQAPIGSFRASAFSQPLADLLWERLAPVLPCLRTVNGESPVDWDGHPVWRPTGVNPLMRFIRYEEGGLLVPHYDAPYAFDSLRRTLMSVVVYLSDSVEGGATRFVRDPQDRLPPSERRYEDWAAPAPAGDVVASVRPKAGTALVFDHRILHECERVSAGTKLVLRTDVVFDRCDWYADG